MTKFYNISEVSKLLELVDPKTKRPLNHVLRYWESQFSKIRPKKINNRRYYTLKQIELIRMIKFLLKTKGLTISGTKNLINSNTNKLDYYDLDSLKTDYYKANLKNKSKILLDKINKIKNHGKKNSSKSKNGPGK